ncbi:MAG: DUF4124 domain-containing protein [Myxococcaceae bacterium]|jgi:hypothetical protein|nr:DUF4124 domain-containing protein [Myxococcaceae bacterium]MCA3013295.1 DUF4124 domain-containing protein [Myxococcaceae bacterium]
MYAALLLVLSQVYVWTDARGEVHYTDDRGSIPKGVKVRTTEGAEIELVPSGPPARPPPRPPAPVDANGAPLPLGEATDACEVARGAVSSAEAKLAEAQRTAQLKTLTWRGDCREVRATFGEAAFEKCMAVTGRTRRAPQPPDPGPIVGPAERTLEEAREALRRAQQAGCPAGAPRPAAPRQAIEPPRPAGGDTCLPALAEVRRLEDRLFDARRDAALWRRMLYDDRSPAERSLFCSSSEGAKQGSYARCMARRRGPQPPNVSTDPAPTIAPLERDLEAARDRLRRVQVSGCQ